jgi:hypothetical protein
MTPTVQAAALFASRLEPSDEPTVAEVVAAIADGLRRCGGAAGCAAILAAEYGEHPEAAAARMRWALALTAATGGIGSEPAAA